MTYIDIVKRLNNIEGVGKLNLEQLIMNFFNKVSGFKAVGVELTEQEENYYKANVYYTLVNAEKTATKNKIRIKFNDVTFFAKKLGYERYDGAWRKILYENLNSSTDKKALEASIQKYADGLEADVFSK
ncbi:MAG: hypothetical protein IJA69_02965 [Clostridia bacterium]|nr:hypothetical protein [Clostridia bacterium]